MWQRVGLFTAAAATAVAAIAMVRATLAAGTASRHSKESATSKSLPAVEYHDRISIIAERLCAAIRLRTISWDPPDQLDSVQAAPRCGCHAMGNSPVPPGPAPTPLAVEETRDELLRFHALLHEWYPLLHSRAEVRVIHDLTLVFVLRGLDTTLPASVLYAHMDVVPAPDADSWQIAPPFSGTIVDGYVVGRGAM